MNFSEVLNCANELTSLLNTSTKCEMIKAVTLAQPEHPMDELYFIKLATWSYGFFIEAGQPALREVGNLLKISDPAAATKNGINNKTIQDLRTVLTHNLPGDEKSSDGRTKYQVNIWLFQNGGEPTNWEQCCQALCTMVIEIIKSLSDCWAKVISDPADAANSVKQIRDTIENKWAPHELDRMVEEAASIHNITGLDVVAYRKIRWKEWSELSTCFSSRVDADIGLRRHIQAELKMKFL